MKTLWILSAFIGLTLPEKLDRTYLPPPGSKFSGGSLGEIDVPLEFPKETYPSSPVDNNFRQPEIAIGIDRVGSNISPEKLGDITSIVPLLHGNSFGFPTTTTSYAFSQTTSYVPAADSTLGPEVSISSKYPFNNSVNNPTPDFLGEKNLSFDYARPNSVYNAVEDKRMLNYINNDLENQLSDNRINSQEVQKITDERGHSNNGIVNSIPEINSYSDNLGIPGTTSTRTEVDHSLLNNSYDTNYSSPVSEPINEDVNHISSTPMPPDNVHYKTPTEYVPTASSIGSTIIPYSYRTRPQRIQAQDKEAVILNYDNSITPDSYTYSFDTSNGIHADEKGIAINGVQAVGSYSYIGDDGQLYSVNYTAGENGFRPYGAHLPTAPPIPDAILKVIEQAALDKANGIYDDGSYDEKKYGYQNYDPTKNNRFLNQYNKERAGPKLNKNISNNHLPHYNRLGDNLNKDNDKVIENKQNVITKNRYMKNELANESITELLPNYKSKDFENKGNELIGSSNNDYNNEFQNKILNSMPLLRNREKEDRIKSIEFYDETGYHYSKPGNDFSLEAADKLLNRLTETPASIKIPTMYKKAVKNVPVRLFMTPYVSRNDDNFVEHDDGDDNSLDIPTENKEEENVVLSNQYNRTFLTSAETKMVPGKTENKMNHNFNNQFEQPDISRSDDQGYLYNKNVITNNDSYVPYITSTEIGLPDITSTIPTAFPRRFNTIESSKDNNSRNPSKLSESSLFQNKAALPHPSVDHEKYQGPSTHSNNLDNFGNNNNYDVTDPGPKYNTPNMYGAVKDYIMEHSTAKTYNEDFSGPKQAQKYDPLTGYHY